MSGRIHIINITPGPLYIAWCDECLLSHAFAEVHTVTERGVTHLGTWCDGHGAEEDE